MSFSAAGFKEERSFASQQRKGQNFSTLSCKVQLDYFSTSNLTGTAGIRNKEEVWIVVQKEGDHSSGYICTEVEKASVFLITLVSSFEIVWKFLPQSFAVSCSQNKNEV